MKIAIGTINTVKNSIFSGFYYQTVTGLRGKLYEFSSPSSPLNNFSLPYDAFLSSITPTGNKLIAAGNRLKNGCLPSTNRSGALYFSDKVQLFGTCHGFGHDSKTYYSGFNFYNAFYPAGYFTPPFGETISIFKSNLDGFEALKNGGCNTLTVTEYNEQFGIVSKSASDVDLTTNTLTPNIYAPIYSPKEACPPDVTLVSYYDEIQFSNIAGNTTNLGSNNFYNSNPIPTSLDNYEIKVNGRYSTVKDNIDPKISYIVYTGGRPVSSYTISNEQNKLNNTLCLASLMETKISAGRGTNGVQLIEAPDALKGALGDQVSFASTDPFHYWHFTFQENAETLPFSNNFTAKEDSRTVRQRAIGEGTQLFIPVLSSEDHYWQNRQCPATVDYLPWNFGASIYACPSEHFDVPYYAALRKFGFYGVRFLNTCKALNLDYPLSGVENASELETSNSNVLLEEGEIEPEELDKDGLVSFNAFSNLLRTAKAEERYANMYALNKGFFLWSNTGYILTGEEYLTLASQNAGFASNFLYLVNKFQNVFQSGLSSFTGNEPNLILNTLDTTFTLISSGLYSNILLTNNEYVKFKNILNDILTPAQFDIWNRIEDKYSYYVSSGENIINEEFYHSIISGREKRLITRYFENIIRGNPIDLFPLNNITFSYDSARSYLESTGWARKETSFGSNSPLPEIDRRYFEGAYGRNSAITGLVSSLSKLFNTGVDYYYPGFFQDVRFDKDIPTPKYFSPVSGLIQDTVGRRYSPSGWLALGYNEIGGLDANFSCFTPIFIQHPIPKVFCKIGQRPTLRTLAVDYHTIPEDKLSRKYPELSYWASKLKLLDCNGRNLYPLKYKWYRILKSEYSQSLSDGFFSNAEAASITGNWSCLEGDGPNCTLYHPTESYPIYTGVHDNVNNYNFIKGAIKDEDDKYYYLCLTSGRFGVRMSNPTELNIENWLRFDMSVKNGLNLQGSLSINLEMTDHLGVERKLIFENTAKLAQYGGYQQDSTTAPESVVEQKIPPPNAGWGDVTAYRFIGPIGYIGATRSYTPAALKDSRGLQEVWGHILEFGQLVPFEKLLTQNDGDRLYGYNHLPVCENYTMDNGKKGIKVTALFNEFKIGHWSIDQKAVASLDNKAGIQWDKLFNLGELYPPILNRYDRPNFAIGHWQFGNNLGSIKRFGKFSTVKSKDIKFVGGYTSSDELGNNLINNIKQKLIGSTDLAGTNCGYHPYGLGRNMIYYLEAYERFYILCDAIKKKNISNKSFICPGVRLTNSAIQYFWLGQPSNTYLKRKAMYGPYAYQWKVQRHNRDRNGNGISEGFYSAGYGKKYSLLYDAPATYGLYVKSETSNSYITALKDLKSARDVLGTKYGIDIRGLRNTWFGERRNEGTSKSYGNISYSCDPTSLAYNTDICNYVSSATSLATNINFSDHYCSSDLIGDGQCFDPCMSMRYAQGFFPGGKSLDLFNSRVQITPNSKETKNFKIVPIATFKNDSVIVGDELSLNSDNLIFRNPLNTPHARITQGLKEIANTIIPKEFVAGVAPCQDGGSDHCNYITPTIHIGPSSYLVGKGNIFSQRRNILANIYSTDANIRGEVS
jgi:hypothetical protein